MKNVRRLVSIFSAAAIASCVSVTAFADDYEMLSKEEIIEYLFDETYDTRHGDDGTTFPQASYEHAYISWWVDRYYGLDSFGDESVYEWSELGRIYDNYVDSYSFNEKKYGDQSGWHFNDDGVNWIIEKKNDEGKYETLYRFEYINGMWNMIDTNGNTVDTFPPISTLEEEDEEETEDLSSATDTLDEDGDDGEARVTGTYTESAETATADSISNVPTQGSTYTASAAETLSEAAEIVSEGTTATVTAEEETTASAAPYIIGGVVVAAGVATAIVVKKKKK